MRKISVTNRQLLQDKNGLDDDLFRLAYHYVYEFSKQHQTKFKTMLHYMVLQKHMFNLYNFILAISSNLYLSIMYS